MDRLYRCLLLTVLAASIALINQVWVGRGTIYSSEYAEQRERLHEAILYNRPPDDSDSWSSAGANGLNVRILTVWGAEWLHRLTGQPVLRGYFIIESLGLFFSCMLLFYFLYARHGPQFAVGGLLYFSMVLPLTYKLHYFHPWDKPSLALWILSLMLLQRRRLAALTPVLMLGTLIKYDNMLLPLLYFFAFASQSDWRKPLLTSAALLCITIGTYVMLRIIIPGGFEYMPVLQQLELNLKKIAALGIAYPPLLALGVPTVLAAYGFSAADRFAKALVLLGGVQFVVLFSQSNFVEFRAEMPLLVLLMPAAKEGLARLMARSRGRTASGCM